MVLWKYYNDIFLKIIYLASRNVRQKTKDLKFFFQVKSILPLSENLTKILGDRSVQIAIKTKLGALLCWSSQMENLIIVKFENNT